MHFSWLFFTGNLLGGNTEMLVVLLTVHPVMESLSQEWKTSRGLRPVNDDIFHDRCDPLLFQRTPTKSKIHIKIDYCIIQNFCEAISFCNWYFCYTKSSKNCLSLSWITPCPLVKDYIYLYRYNRAKNRYSTMAAKLQRKSCPPPAHSVRKCWSFFH